MGKINRNEFGLQHNTFKEFGELGIDQDIELTATIEFTT
jgi:hypothetical protein